MPSPAIKSGRPTKGEVEKIALALWRMSAKAVQRSAVGTRHAVNIPGLGKLVIRKRMTRVGPQLQMTLDGKVVTMAQLRAKQRRLRLYDPMQME